MRATTMSLTVVIVIVCGAVCSLNCFTRAVSTHRSLTKSSHGVAASHETFHRLEPVGSSDSEEDSEHGRVSRNYHHGNRGLLSDLGTLVTGAADLAGKTALSALKVGHKLALPPLKGVEWLTGKASSAVGLQKILLNTIAGTAKSAWEQAKAIEFPGKSIVALVFPNRIVTIADKLTNDVMYVATKTKSAVKASLAYSLYATLKVIFSAIAAAIKTLGFHCIPINKTSLAVNNGLIDTVEISEGSICGLDELQPINNVTISKDDSSFMVITMPWVLKNLEVKIKSVDVTGLLGSMIKDQPVETTVEEVALQGTISFQKGTFLRFMALHLEMEGITGIHIKLEGAVEEGGAAAGVINSLAGILGGVVQELVNAQLVEMEKLISDNLLGKML